jgi:hypothetical protein
VKWLQSAVDQKPDCGEAWCNLGNTYGDLGKLAEAMDCYRRAILNQPDYAQARLNRAIGLLRIEKFDEGWLEYEWRYKLKECPKRPFPKPRWDGRPLKERKLLLHAEQGLGDTIQMVRYIAPLREAGHTVILECQKAIVPLMQANNVADEVVGLGDKLPEYDVHLPLMSAPSLLFDEYGFAENRVPYLKPSSDRVEKWSDRIQSLPGKKIGIFWQGNPNFKQDHLRSIPLAEFDPLLQCKGVSFISLQKGFGEDQISAMHCSNLHKYDDLDSEGGAFMDTAAVLTMLDLVVTSDSAIAHLAGALGVETMLMLPSCADWRWFVNRTDSPWYPKTHLFRKSRTGNWRELIAEVTSESQKRLSMTK